MWQQTKQVTKNQNECRAKFFNVFFNLEISTREHINTRLRQKHHMRPSSKILRANTVFGRFYFQFVQMLEVLKCREDHHSKSRALCSCGIPARLNFSRFSFRNCISCVFNCDDLFCIYFFISQFKCMKFIYSSFRF